MTQLEDKTSAPSTTRSPQARPGTGVGIVVAGLVAVAATTVYSASGSSPGPLLVVTGIVLFGLLAQLTRWRLGLALAVVIPLGLLGLAMQVYPTLGVSVATGGTALLSILATGSLGVLWLRRGRLVLPPRTALVPGLSCVAVPTLALLAALAIELRAQGSKVAWIMANDSAWNMMSARFIVEDGGLDVAKHANVAPLTAEFIGLFIAPGRAALQPGALLQHDVHRSLQALLLLVAVMSVIGSVSVIGLVPARFRFVRSVVALGAGLVPWTWFVAGYALFFGFWNAVLAGVVLLVTWLAWLEAPRAPRTASAVQVVAAMVLLAAWAPLVIVPVGFGAAIVLRFWRGHFQMRWLALATWLIPVMALLVYAYVLVRPAFVSSSTGLASDGGFFAFHLSTAVVIFLLALGTVVLSASLGGSRWDLLGVVLLGAVGGVGVAYLMHQRADSISGTWGYYPQKFSWLLCMLVPFVTIRAIGGLTPLSVKVAGSSGVALAALLSGAVVVAQVPPQDTRPYSIDANPAPHPPPDYRLVSMFNLWSLAHADGVSDLDPAARVLFRVSGTGDKVLLARWFHDPTLDTFVNFWLIQQSVAAADEPVRSFAYTLKVDDPQLLCDTVDAWGGGVTIRTRDRRLSGQMQKICPGSDFTVVRRTGGLVPSRS